MWNEMVRDEEIVFDREESAYPGTSSRFCKRELKSFVRFEMENLSLFQKTPRTVLALRRRTNPTIKKKKRTRRPLRQQPIIQSSRRGTGGGSQVGSRADHYSQHVVIIEVVSAFNPELWASEWSLIPGLLLEKNLLSF